MSLPETEEIDGLIADVYAASEQGLTLLTAEMSAVRKGETLIQPRAQIDVAEQSGARVKIESLVLTAPTDESGGQYRARVEYSLAGGGWRPSEARVTDVLTGPTAVSLADVQNDIDAVRVTYLNAETGEERADSGFAPGQITLNIKTGVDGEAQLNVQTRFDGTLLVRHKRGAAGNRPQRRAKRRFHRDGKRRVCGGFRGRGRQNQRRGVYGWQRRRPDGRGRDCPLCGTER